MKEPVERVEALFDTARSALGALRPEEAERSLTEAERLLLAHPELPQAAWLLAECHTLSAEWQSARDPNAARARRAAAAALEGPRAAPFREGASTDVDVEPAASIAFDVRGLAAGDRLEWDAQPRALPLSTAPGQHQLRVLRGARVIWASWVTVSAANPALSLNLPRVTPCSAEDLAATVDGARGPVAPALVACREWAVARSGAGELEIALCRGARCGDWHRAPPARDVFEPPAQALTHKGFPRWASYALAGAGAAAMAGLVLLEGGVFGSEGPARERWKYMPVR